MIKFLSSLSGDSLSIIIKFSRASHCELFQCFVGNFMANFLEISSCVPIFFSASDGKLSPYFIWRLTVNNLTFYLMFHRQLTRCFVGHLTVHYLTFCRVSHGERHPNTLKSITPCSPRQNNTKTLRFNMIVYTVSPGNLILCLKEKL